MTGNHTSYPKVKPPTPKEVVEMAIKDLKLDHESAILGLDIIEKIEKITDKIYLFSLDWDSGEYSDDEWEKKRRDESRTLAIELLKIIQSSPTTARKEDV